MGQGVVRSTIAVLAFAASACGGAGDDEAAGRSTAPVGIEAQTIDAGGEPVAGGRLVMGLAADTNNWSPAQGQWAGQGYQVARSVFDPLAAFDERGDVTPYLAESFEANDDFTEWTIVLRSDVEFHDGTALDADAVVANLEAQRASIVTGAALSPVAAIEPVGDLRVRLVMDEPWSTFPGYLTSQIGFIAAPAMLADPDGGQAPIGTGPFVFESWASGDAFVALRNERYWQEGRPYLESVEFRVLPDEVSRRTALDAGDIELTEAITTGQIDAFQQQAEDGNLQVWTDPRDQTNELTLALNTSAPPFDDLDARRAVASAIDTELLSTTIFDGLFAPARGPYPPGADAYVETEYPVHDDAVARELAQDYEARTGTQLSFALLLPPDPEVLRAAQFIASELEEVGIDMELASVEQTELLVSALSGDFQATAWLAFSGGILEDQNVFLDPDNATGEGLSLNFTRIRDDEIGEALDAMRTTDDPAELLDQTGVIEQRLGALVPYVFLVHTRALLVGSPELRGVGSTVLPDGSRAVLDGSLTWLHEIWFEDAGS